MKSLKDHDIQSFVELSGSESARRVVFSGGTVRPANADAVTASYPSTVVEVYEYRQGGVAGTVLQTVTVTYTNSTKERVASVEWT